MSIRPRRARLGGSEPSDCGHYGPDVNRSRHGRASIGKSRGRVRWDTVSRRLGAVALLALAAFVLAFSASAASPTISFQVYARTGRDLDSIVWTGTQFLYVENTANIVWSAPPSGLPLSQFASMPKLVEETRDACSRRERTGFPSRCLIFCHSPDNKIYEISADGSSTTVFATLPAPYPPAADGALAFDTVGRFGYQLVAATGRSGANQALGGQVFTIGAGGAVAQVGSYAGPGADELIIAPAGFGTIGGDVLLTLDGGAATGELVAMNAAGQTRTLATPPRRPQPDRGDRARVNVRCRGRTASRPLRHQRHQPGPLLRARLPAHSVHRRSDRGKREPGAVLDRRAKGREPRLRAAATQPPRAGTTASEGCIYIPPG